MDIHEFVLYPPPPPSPSPSYHPLVIIMMSINDLINHAIVTAGRLDRVDEAIEIFEKIPKLGFSADLMSYNNIIWTLGHCGRLEMAKKYFTRLSKTTKPNVYSYGALMHGYARSKNAVQALLLLEEMKKANVVPNTVVFTSAMEACVESGRHREAMSLLQTLSSYGIKPDLAMINSAIKACCLVGAMDDAERLSQTLRENGKLDLFSYHTLMMGHMKKGGYQRVIILYEEAIASEIQLDGGIFSLAMVAAIQSKLYYLVPRMAESAREVGAQLTEPSYTLLIQAFGELGVVDEAIACLDRMEADGLRPNVVTYSALISVCKHRADDVLALLKRMEKNRVKPNIVTLTSAIHALAMGGSANYTDMAYGIWRRMEDVGPKPNLYTYNTILRAFAEAGRVKEAFGVLQTVKERNLSPDLHTFTTLLLACGYANQSSLVDGVLTMMRQDGVFPDEIAYGAALDAYRRSNDSLKALQLLQEMFQNHIEPSAAHINLVIRTLKAQGYADKMFKMIMQLVHKEGIRMNANAFELVVESLLEFPNKHKDILYLLQTMDRLGHRLSLDNCVAFIQYLESQRQYKIALGMYKYMIKQGYEFYENKLLNDIFTRMIKLAGLGGSDIKQSAPMKDLFTELETQSLGIGCFDKGLQQRGYEGGVRRLHCVSHEGERMQRNGVYCDSVLHHAMNSSLPTNNNKQIN
eukprot:scaffold4562_cov183-Ochromonas_danica.AAC.2